MLELIKTYFSLYYESESDLKKFDFNNGMQTHYFIKSNKNIIICITLDYKENEVDLFVTRDIKRFDEIPLKLYEMEQAIKNNNYKKRILKLKKKSLKENIIFSFNIMKDFIEEYIKTK